MPAMKLGASGLPGGPVLYGHILVGAFMLPAKLNKLWMTTDGKPLFLGKVFRDLWIPLSVHLGN